MKINNLKKSVAQSAIKYISSKDILGIGTGTTVNYFIDIISKTNLKFNKIVSSSYISTDKLNNLGINTINLNSVNYLDVYIDSADEINKDMYMIKGAGGALTQEKIMVELSKKFICIADFTKLVTNFSNKCPLPIEIIPSSKNLVELKLKELGGIPKIRNNIITDNGNLILDIYNLNINNAILLEKEINNIPGVITVGLFTRRKADILLISKIDGIEVIYGN